MRNIVISTHRKSEYKKIANASTESKSIVIENVTDKILAFLNEDDEDDIQEINSQINALTGLKLFLYHGPIRNVNIVNFDHITDVGPGNDNPDDTSNLNYFPYIELLDGKMGVFGKTWSMMFDHFYLKKIAANYFEECISEFKWKELPNEFATTKIIERWSVLKEKPFNSQSVDYDDFYKMLEDIWQ